MNRELHEAILARLHGVDCVWLHDLILGVIRDCDSQLELVVSAMWDLVDEGTIDYGTDAYIRLIQCQPLAV